MSIANCRGSFALLAGVFLLVASEPAGAALLTLREAVEKALALGPDAMIARLEAERAEETVAVARGAYLPTLAVTSQAGYSNRQNEKLRAVDKNGVERTYGLATLGSNRGWLNVFVRQLLLDLRAWRDIERSQLEAEAAEMAENEQREMLAFAVLERYLDVLRLERLVELDEERLEGARQLDDQAQILLDAGRALPTEREHAAIHFEEVRMGLTLRRQELRQGRKRLLLILGQSEADAQNLEVSSESVPVPAPPEELHAADETAVLTAAPDLKTLELRQQADEKAVSVARADRYPRLGVNAGYFHYGTKRYDNFIDEFAVGVDFEMTLFDGFRTSHQVEGATKQAEIARLRYRNMLEEKRARVRELLRRFEATEKQPELAQRRAAMARERMRLANLNLQAQRGTLEEALAIRIGYATDAESAIGAQFDRVLTWAELNREIGHLSDSILAGAP